MATTTIANSNAATKAEIVAVADTGLAATALQPADVGTAAAEDVGYFATAAQGSTADTALQPADVGTAAAEDVGYFATAAQGSTADSALQDVVDDTTPTLGGNLDVGGNSIVSTSAGDIAITPDTTGDVILDGLKWPQADGTTDYVLKTNGAGQLGWTANGSGSGLADVVDDTTPQLGGDLDLNGHDIPGVVLDGDIGTAAAEDVGYFATAGHNHCWRIRACRCHYSERRDIGTSVQAYDSDTAKLDTAQVWTAQQNFQAVTTGNIKQRNCMESSNGTGSQADVIRRYRGTEPD